MKDPVLWLDKNASEVLKTAHEAAAERGDCLVEPEHLLQAIAGREGATAFRRLQRLGLDTVRLRSDLERAYDFPRGPLPPRSTVLSTRTRTLLHRASQAAVRGRRDRIGIDQMILAIIDEDSGRAAEALAQQGIDAASFQASMDSLEAERQAGSRPTLVKMQPVPAARLDRDRRAEDGTRAPVLTESHTGTIGQPHQGDPV